MTDHEALDALVKIAGEIPISAYPGKSYDERSQNAVTMVETLIDLSKALRTGQLIPAPSVDDAMVERVARSLAPFMEGGREYDQMPATRRELKIWSRNGMALINDATQDDAQEAATTAISAMQVKP